MTKTIQTTNAEAKTLSEKEQPTEKIALETMSQPIKINKTKLMVELLSAENGSSIKELASKLNWLENSVRGAMSLYAKNHPEYTHSSEKVDGVRSYRLTQNGD
ncbi:MAG: DUF3489 domain-containing protein [Alphaproteobacteria bacterium]